MTKLVVAFSLVVLLASSASSTARSNRDAVLDREEYAVYSALISQRFIKNETRLIVITNPTCCDISEVTRENLNLSVNQLLPFSQDTLESLRQRNKETKHLQGAFKLAVPYQIVDYNKIKKLFEPGMFEDEWKTFYRWYPRSNGYITLSRVGFNRDGDEALVNTGWMSGALSGEGHYFLLSKKAGKWQVQRAAATWMV
jgi:hypothetical protein